MRVTDALFVVGFLLLGAPWIHHFMVRYWHWVNTYILNW